MENGGRKMPMNKKDYPVNWKELSAETRKKAGNKCELCGKPNGSLSDRGTKVVLTVHHIDGNKLNNKPLNRIALCQKCHLRLDLAHHIEEAQKTRLKKSGKRLLPF